MIHIKSLLFLFATLLFTVNASYFDITVCDPIFFPCIHVSPNGLDTNDGSWIFPVRTVQAALNLVSPPWETHIVLQDGTYPGGIVWHGSGVKLTSVHGSDFSFIDCNHTPEQHGLWIGSGESHSTLISGVTIQNCNATFGGGMVIVGPDTKPTLKNVVFRHNQATMGAGLFVLFASPTLISTETHDGTGRDGIGIYVLHNASVITKVQLEQLAIATQYTLPTPIPDGANSVLTVIDHTASGNRAVGIGACMFAQGATVVVTGGLFYNNMASGSGGIAAGGSHLTLTDSSFLHNHATEQFAGGVAVREGSFGLIKGVTFSGNSAAQGGGAIVVGEPLSTLIADSCVFTNNQASVGSIIAFDPTPRTGSSITNCVASGNVASQYGGIFFNNIPTARAINLSSNKFSNNKAPFGADFGSMATSIGFIAPDETQIGDSTHSPATLPAGYSTTISRSIAPLGPIALRIVIVDTFGQRITAPGVVNFAFLDSVPITPGAPNALLVMSNSRIELDNGIADVTFTIVGQPSSTYDIRVSTPHPVAQVPLAHVHVAIGACTNPASPTCGTCINLV